jgi:hypothetical protein
MASAAYVGFTPFLDALEGALIDLVVVLALGRADQFPKFIVETFGAEVALFLRNPFLQAEMRLYDELAHRKTSGAVLPLDPATDGRISRAHR